MTKTKIEPQYIRDKLAKIRLFYSELEELFKHSPEEIKKDFVKYHALERLLQLIVDEIIDVNNHFVNRLDLEPPDDFQGTFSVLAKAGILPEDFARKIAPVVGLRNQIVHRYEKIDLEILIQQVQIEREDFRKYVEYVEEKLDKF